LEFGDVIQHRHVGLVAVLLSSSSYWPTFHTYSESRHRILKAVSQHQTS
jgi:hypothetical protein